MDNLLSSHCFDSEISKNVVWVVNYENLDFASVYLGVENKGLRKNQ